MRCPVHVVTVVPGADTFTKRYRGGSNAYMALIPTFLHLDAK